LAYNIVLGPRVRKSPYFDATVAAGATHFTVYNHMYMPISYGDMEAEYWRLVRGVSLWDVAAERQVEIGGRDAEALVRYLTPRDLAACRVGRARYVPLCNHHGHLINDPVLLRLSADRFWLSIADSDMLHWVRAVAAEGGFDVSVHEPDVSPLAVQGPLAVEVVASLFGEHVRSMKLFQFEETDLDGIPLVLARSGWSRQGGFELFLMDGNRGVELWDRVAAAGAAHGIGPGAPNPVERVESALLSYAADNEPDSSPFEVGLGSFVHVDRDDAFIGKEALTRIAGEGPPRKLVGLFVHGERLAGNEHPWPVSDNKGERMGAVRVAAFSLRLERNIAIALVDTRAAGMDELVVETPLGSRQANVTDLPFL